MTFLEKLKQVYPDYVGPQWFMGARGCPFLYGFEQEREKPCLNAHADCIACWDREMPGTVPTPKNELAIENGAGEADGMTAEREGRILEDAIAKFGEEVQIDIMIEEMAELTKALLKYRRWHEGTGARSDERLNDILEEMADVQIMLNQMALIFGDSTEYEIAKLERLEKRIAAHG